MGQLLLRVGDVTSTMDLLAGRRRQISISLTIIAVLLWTYSILYADLEIGYLGLIHSLPVTFFVAIALLTVASAILWISREKHGKLLFLQLLLLIGAMWLIPVVTGGSPPFMNHSYYNLGLTNHIVETGIASSSGRLWYLAWPGSHILYTIITIVGAIDFEPLFNVLPIFFRTVILLPLYLFLRNTLGRERTNYCWAGLWLFLLATWGGGTYGSPQGVALILLLTVLAIITAPLLREKDSPKLALLLALGLLTAAIVPTHMLTSLALVLMLSAFSLATRNIRLVPIIGLCLLLIVCWDVTGGRGVVRSITRQPLWSPAMESPIPTVEIPVPGAEIPTSTVKTPITGVELPIPYIKKASGVFTLNPAVITEQEIAGHLRGSASHIAVVRTRILHSAIFASIGIAGAIFVLLVRRKSEAVAILAMALTPLLLLPISGHYGEELLQRIYGFSLPFMAYFGARLLDMRSKLPWLILCLLLIIACPTQIVTRYGNQVLDYFPDGRIAGMKFFDRHATHGFVTGASPLGRTANLLQYKFVRYHQLRWRAGELYKGDVGEMPYYVAISNRDRSWYEWFWGNDRFIGDVEHLLNSAVNCRLVYSNPVFILWASHD